MGNSDISSGNQTPAPLEKPVQFGRYLLLERMAIGGMAEILRAVHNGPHDFRKTVVVKRMLPHLATDAAFVDMFIDEARLMGQINHPRVVQVFDFGEIEGQYFMAMEYVDGTDALTLLQRCAISRRRPPPQIAVQIVADVLDALDYAHQLHDEAGQSLAVVHRDVSPSNIFISQRGDVKLGDFGIVRMAVRRSETQAGILKGKYGYMAPEQVAGKPIDQRRDVFAAGIVLAELLMVRRLFLADNELDVLLQVRDARLDRLDRYGQHIPAALRAILDAALARNPDLRYQSASDFYDALMHYLQTENRTVTNAAVRRFLDRVTPADQRRPGQSPPQEEDSSRRMAPFQVGTKRPIKLGPPASAAPLQLSPTREELRLGTADALAAIPELERTSSSVVTAGSIEVPSLDSLPPIPNAQQVASALLSSELDPVPHLLGRLSERSLFCVLFRLGYNEQTGLVAVNSGTASKQLFLVDGHPQLVLSNQPNDLFGQFLLKSDVITDGELSMALAMVPHFNGRLGDALVGLELLSPVEVLRHLTALQHQKVLELFRWTDGSFAFHPGLRAQEENAPLGMTTFELLGDAARELPLDQVRAALAPLMEQSVGRIAGVPVPPEAFQLGTTPRLVYEKIDADIALAENIKRYGLPAEAVLPVVHLLLQTGYLAPTAAGVEGWPCPPEAMG